MTIQYFSGKSRDNVFFKVLSLGMQLWISCSVLNSTPHPIVLSSPSPILTDKSPRVAPAAPIMISEAPLTLWKNQFRAHATIARHFIKSANEKERWQFAPYGLNLSSALWSPEFLDFSNKKIQLWTDLFFNVEKSCNAQLLLGCRKQMARHCQVALYPFYTLADLKNRRNWVHEGGIGGVLATDSLTGGMQGRWPFKQPQDAAAQAVNGYEWFLRWHSIHYTQWAIENWGGFFSKSDGKGKNHLNYHHRLSCFYRWSHFIFSFGAKWQDNSLFQPTLFFQCVIEARKFSNVAASQQVILPDFNGSTLPHIPRQIFPFFEDLSYDDNTPHESEPQDPIVYPNKLSVKVFNNRAHIHDDDNADFSQNSVDYQWLVNSGEDLPKVLTEGRDCSIISLRDNDELICRKIDRLSKDGLHPVSTRRSEILDEITVKIFPQIQKIQASSDLNTGNRVCLFEKMNIIPLSPTDYNLRMIESTNVDVSDIAHPFRTGFDMDAIYCQTAGIQNDALELCNNTPRTLFEPVILINGEYWKFSRQTLQPFQSFRIKCLQPIHTSLYMETNACWKMRALEFPIAPIWTEDRAKRAAKGDETHPVLEADRYSGFPTQETVQQCIYFFIFQKYLLNRFDIIHKIVESAAVDDGFFKNNLVSCPGYLVQVLKYLFTHPNATTSKMILQNQTNVIGLGSGNLSPSNKWYLLENLFFNGALSDVVEPVYHEMNHNYGFNHDCGMTYGWSENLALLGKENYANHLSNKSFCEELNAGELKTQLIERCHYFADYLWKDALTLEIDFYNKNSEPTQGIQSFYLFVNDGEVPDALNISEYPELKRENNGMSIRTMFYAQQPTIEQLNDHRLRIRLQHPFRSHAATVVFIGTGLPALAANHSEGEEAENIALVIPYRGAIEIVEPLPGDQLLSHHSTPWTVLAELDPEIEKKIFEGGGNSGHVGLALHQLKHFLPVDYTTQQTFHAMYYRSFNKALAYRYLTEKGYHDFAPFPFDLQSQELADWAANYQNQAVLIGRDPQTQTVKIVTPAGESKNFATMILAR